MGLDSGSTITKVYCKECKGYIEHGFSEGDCKFVKKKTPDTWYEKGRLIPVRPSQQNKYNNCQYYKAK